ncbi:P-loop containing nucleoside triphosphate hydrolase protein [Aspergillus ellipticus CBS 707.79]|uniref:P-loop containing nucleoside triphosphate hydrolase protein n=1 Tax=Aspergillus ellipticus CBS 707.79 TaxID=1448320 RepID=A0A319CZZ8_9EURO|nr:P-loop containing nucleoside triphosphate hydrolase protein [Aspergillus ellipticus CBS 707.79]
MASDSLRNGGVEAAEDSQASDNDGGERPVRNKLKETSITSAPKNPTEINEEGDSSRASSRGRKRSFDEDQPENTEDDQGHRRKRSRDSANEEENATAEVQPQEAEELSRKILSPKKKRSRDQLDKDEPKAGSAAEQSNRTAAEEASTEKSAVEGQPEKKRHTDNSREEAVRIVAPVTSAFANTSSVSPFGSIGAAKSTEQSSNPSAVTSSSAFAASSLAAFASSEQSPFGSLGASTSSVFKPSTTDASKPAATGFATAAGTSGFAAMGSGFSGFSGGFGSSGATGGLTSFAAPAGPSVLTSSKPIAFGAPEADEDKDDEDEEADTGPGEFEQDKTDERFFERPIETGEENEKTYFSCKAKLYKFSDREWKERGLGTFKINVRVNDGVEDKKAARMIMRADGGMTVGDGEGKEPKSKHIHLASLENGRSVPILLRPASEAVMAARPQNIWSSFPWGFFTSKYSQWSASMAGPRPQPDRPTATRGRKRAQADPNLEENPNACNTRASSSSTTSSVPPSKRNRRAASSQTPAETPEPEDGKNSAFKTAKRKPAQPKRTPSAPWPEAFKTLSRTHRALNLVYTFCCTRKHFATTFDNIKKAVQAQMQGQELTVEDVARVKVLVPRMVRFEYVDEAKLEVMTVGEKEAKEFGYGRDVMEDSGAKTLLFELLDGDLKREVKHPQTGEPTKPMRKMKNEDLKMPVYSQTQMLGLIEKRNKKFTDAMDAFLVRCEDEGVDPVERLETEKHAWVPVPPDEDPRAGVSSTVPQQIPKDRKSMAEIVEEIREMDWVFEAQPPVYGELTFQLSQNLVNALYNTKGITQFYTHQAEAINHLYDGHNVIVSTSTSSGKSLIYQVPMLHELEKDPHSRGLYIFPTKALAQDQRRSMQELLQFMDGLQGTMVETFDGDTPMPSRNLIRDEARIIFTNPDMLHITILPQEGSWRTFLRNLKFVVVDELHVYNGLFGTHVAFIMRRLRRVCAAVGNHHVRFISCSATVANPENHMKAIFGINDVKLIDFDGSPSGRKEFLCWNTPYKDPNDPASGRADSVAETARLFCQLLLRGARVIAFCRIRKMCEVLLQAVRAEFQALERPEIGNFVMGYRGGYSPQDRRTIETDMFEGRLMGIVATNALELGVDIGSLDAVITLGFPYSISNLRQQSGRAGRRNKDSLSVLVGDRHPTDQYYMRNPDDLLTKPNTDLQIDLTNDLILEGHIQCAAFEVPIHPVHDTIYFGPQLPTILTTRLTPDPLGLYHCHARFLPHPSRSISIRDVESTHFAVIDTTNARNLVLEEVEASRAFFTIYEGGIFLHQGQTYLVQELNPDRLFARVTRVHVDWNTLQRDYTDIDPIETETIRPITLIPPSSSSSSSSSSSTTTSPSTPSSSPPSRAYFGTILIHAVVYGFFKVDKRGRILDAVTVDNNPPINIHTKGMWLDIPPQALSILSSRFLNIAAAIHAAEHAVLSLLPTFVVSVPGDVRTECKVAKKELGRGLRLAVETQRTQAERTALETKVNRLQPPKRQRPARLTFYDAKGGACGSGIAAKAFEFVDVLLRRAVERIEACGCVAPQGCLECVCDERCKEMNEVMSKAGAAVVLRCLLGWEIDVEALPWGEVVGEEAGGELRGGLETVVPAVEVPFRAGSGS